MEPNELRIGNWYKWIAEGKDYYYTVDDIDFCNGNMPNFYPIPLTEEWLIGFGFDQHETNPFWFKKGPICISVLGFIELISSDLQTFKGLGIEIQHVHQLQNLYFALTGEELKLKDQ